MAGLTPNFKTRRYDSDELARMRSDLPFVCFYVAKLNKHPDIVAILRIPNEAFNDPEHPYCTSESLRILQKRWRASMSRRKNIGGGLSEDSEDQIVTAEDPASGSQRVKWNFRRRNSSDHSSQPHSAPTGLVAQQSENFKRFYRAVVSPTHVRVTAGGRIVPNTRATGALQFEWNSDKQIFEPRKLSSDTEIKPLRVPSFPLGAAFTPGFPQLLPGSLLPSYNHVPQHNPHSLATVATQNMGDLSGNGQAPAPNGESSAGTLHPASMPQPIKISHPSQFDHSKPFVFNGQLVYPLPRGHLPPPYTFPLPVHLIGNPNHGQSTIPPAGFLMPQPAISMAPPPVVNTAPLDQNSTVPNPSTTQPMENVTSYNPYLPLPGHVSVADITKVQIEGFRSHLNFINDQLANAPHPIDTQYLEGQRTDLLAIIEKMETMLTIQLAYDRKQCGATYPNGVMEPGLLDQPEQHAVHGDTRQGCGKGIETTSITSSKKEAVTLCTNIAPALSPTKPTKSEVDQGTDGTSTAKGPIRSESTVRKSKLTAAAAMAPPFQPRTQAMVAANSFSGIATSSSTNPTLFNAQDNGENKTANLGYMAYSPTGTGTCNATLPGPLSTHGTSIYTQNDSLPVTFPHAHTIQQFTAFNDPAVSTISPAAVPYLVGTIPQGGEGNEAKITDLQYPRPLTDDERRARYLYWGRAPRSAYGGLPKFDGKDFYPPSPVKETSRIRTESSDNSTSDRHISPVALNFERLFTVSDTMDYKTANSHQTVGTDLKPGSLDNSNVRFESQSPGPSPRMDQSSSHPGLSADHNGTNNLKCKLVIRHPGDHGNRLTPLEDFPKLFPKQDTPEFSYPKSHHMGISQSNVDFDTEQNVAHRSQGQIKSDIDNKDGDDAKSVDSWGAPSDYSKIVAEVPDVATDTKLRHGNTLHTVAPLAIDVGEEPPTRDHEHKFPGRAENSSSSEQHAAFLQNMLKSTTQVPMAAPALRTVSSATAQGYLPQYRGSAAASLAPAMLSIPGSELYGEHADLKFEPPNQSTSGGVPATPPSLLSENRPLKHARSSRAARPTGDALDAEGYMRYLSQKADEDKRSLESGWNANTTGTSPAMGSNW